MTIPGVGPVVALTYRATVDVPARFRNSKAVGAVFSPQLRSSQNVLQRSVEPAAMTGHSITTQLLKSALRRFRTSCAAADKSLYSSNSAAAQPTS